MDIRHLKYFVEIVEAGSLMKASERLHVAQPALSVHLANLEIELGTQLLSRSNRGISLTEDGRLLFERAVVLLQYYQEAVDAVKSGRRKLRGSVSLGMPSSSSASLCPEIIAAAHNKLPNVKLHLVDASTAALFEWLHEGRLDFAILFNLPDNSGLELSPLLLEEYALVGRYDPDDQSDVIEFEKLSHVPLLLSSRSTVWRKILDDIAHKNGIILTPRVETDSVTIKRAAILAGQGEAIVPMNCFREDIMSKRLRARRIIKPEIRGLLTLAHLSSRPLTRLQQSIKDIILDTVTTTTDAENLSLLSRMSPHVMQTVPAPPFSVDRGH